MDKKGYKELIVFVKHAANKIFHFHAVAFCSRDTLKNRQTGKQVNRLTTTGQSLLEYSILIAVVAAAFVAMAMYVRQAVQGRIYRLEDSVTAKSNKGTAPWTVPI